MSAAVEAVVALGSNLGDRRAHLEGALGALRATPGVRVLAVSPWFETRAVGGPPGQPPFLNGALVLSTELPAGRLLARLLEIERDFGRERGERDAPRSLDLDLLLYGDERIDEPGLVVPHPRMEERLFVLEPLARVAPGRRLPSGRSVRERLAELRRTADPRDAVSAAPERSD